MIRLDEFPPALYPVAWTWLGQYPEWNFDDSGPQTFAAFVEEMDARRARGERLWAVKSGSRYVGMIGVAPVSPRTAMFHGICFDRSVHGQGIAARAVRGVLAQLFGQGIDKVSAAYFATNARIHRLLEKLGAHEEGYLRHQTTRGGTPVDLRLVAFFKEID